MTLRVLTLSTLFPDASRPRFAPFVERQTLELAARDDVALTVVAPIGRPPWPLSRHRRYAAFGALPKAEKWKGIEVLRPRFRHYSGAPRFDPGALAKAVLPLLQNRQIDVIDAEFFWPDGPAAIAIGRALGVPVSIKARGSDIGYWGRRVRAPIVAAAESAAGLLAVSAALREQMIAIGIPGNRIKVHYTGVDLEAFAPRDRDEAKKLLGVSGPLVVCVGNLIEGKGQALLIEAMRAVPEATLVLIGQGPERRTLERAASDQVRLTGALPQAEVARWLAAADAMALPSRSEGLANVWVEALACGTPVVTTDVGGAREVITCRDFGLIVKRSPAAFATALRELTDHPRNQQAVRKGAERFTWEANSQALHAHLRSLI